MSRKSLTLMRSLMGEIFKDAVEDGLMAKDPAASRRLIIPSAKVMVREALPLKEFKDILAQLRQLPDEERCLLSLLMLTGMRRSEALGLRWEDIDVENGLIHVCRNVTHPQTNCFRPQVTRISSMLTARFDPMSIHIRFFKASAAGRDIFLLGANQPHISTPKTQGGERDIPLDPLLMDLLAPMQASGFIIGDRQPITLKYYTNAWNRIKPACDGAYRFGNQMFKSAARFQLDLFQPNPSACTV